MIQLSCKKLLISSFYVISMGISLSTQADIKCWTDQDGITTCGDAVPPEYSQEGFQEFSEEGAYVGDVEHAKTPEEIAAEQRLAELALQKEEERKKREIEEQKLLDLYSSEEDIESARRASIHTIETAIKLNQSYIARLEKNLKDLESSLEVSDNPDTHKMSAEERATTEQSITESKQRILDYKGTIEKKEQEIQSENKKYDDNIIMFREIMERRKQGITKE